MPASSKRPTVIRKPDGSWIPARPGRAMPAVYGRLALLGWALYALAWITPSLHGGGIGARAFVAAARYGAAFAVHPDSLSGFVLGVCLLIGWLANFSIFIPLPVWARIVWIAAPGLPFAAVLLLLPAPLPGSERAAALLYFYPWALGIALIHSAKIAARQRATPLVPM